MLRVDTPERAFYTINVACLVASYQDQEAVNCSLEEGHWSCGVFGYMWITDQL